MDQIAHEKVSKAGDTVTQSAIMGPFFQKDHPVREMGTSIQETAADGAETAFIYGKVLDARTGKPIANAVIDVWLASTNGKSPIPPQVQVEGLTSSQDFTNNKTKIRLLITSAESSLPVKTASILSTPFGQHHIRYHRLVQLVNYFS